MERAVVNEDSGADTSGSVARMDAGRGSEVCRGDECDLETRLGVEYVVGEGEVEER